VETLSPYLFVGGVIAVLIAWSWHFHFWSNSPTARRSRSPLWLGFTATATSALFLIAGVMGHNLNKRGQLFSSTARTDDVIWWEVAIGIVLVPVAIYLLWRGVRAVNRELGRV
jgi:uncharacterized membrane protein